MSIKTIFLFVVFAVLGTSGFAQQSSKLNRLSTENDVKAWRAVGKIQIHERGAYGYCSSALIAPDLVLTAAHCLYNKASQKLVDPSEIVFSAGLTNGVSFVERKGARHVSHPKYDHKNYFPAYDVAIIQLESPVSVFEVPPFKISPIGRVGSSVSVVSYGTGRENTLSKQAICTFTDYYPKYHQYRFNCDSVPGSSGSPIFDTSRNFPRIVSIISGSNDHSSSGPSDLPKIVSDLKTALRTGRGVVEGKNVNDTKDVVVRGGNNAFKSDNNAISGSNNKLINRNNSAEGSRSVRPRRKWFWQR